MEVAFVFAKHSTYNQKNRGKDWTIYRHERLRSSFSFT
jgi:hypothetical protein